jgi:hypothetical protein
MKKLRKKTCDNYECSVSSGIHEGLTFGSGKLDDLGFWEKPCGTCARAREKDHPEDIPCWPFEQEKQTK